MRKMPIDVLHHDDRPIHDHTDRDCQPSQRHQISRQPDLPHDDKCGKRRQYQRTDDDQRAANVPKKKEQHDNNEHHTFSQRLVDRIQRLGDQFNAVLKRHNAQSVR